MSKHYVSLTDVWNVPLPEIQELTGNLTTKLFEQAIQNVSKRTSRDRTFITSIYKEDGVNSPLYHEIKALHRKELLELYFKHQMLDYLAAYFIKSDIFQKYYYYSNLNDLMEKLFNVNYDIRYAGL